ncbi:MAG: hypothetical protein ACREKB_15410, partial [Candidatus Rokuibacteriota bacterium]
MGAGQRAREWLKENTGAVVGADRMEHAFTREALGRGVMDAELGGHLGGSQPPSPAEMLGQAWDPMRDPD